MTVVHTLASGSSGNALVVHGEHGVILIDAGISCRRITAGLQQLGLTPEALDAVVVTHSHTDHISGLQTLLKRTHCPIVGTERTCRELEYRLAGITQRLLALHDCVPQDLCGYLVTAVPTAHDAPGSCGYRFDCPEGSIGILTDTGYITPAAREILPGVDLAVLECNHDVDMLRSGPYPYYLKKRILGEYGHLCNEDAAAFAVTLADAGASQILLAHLSQENNSPAVARRIVETALSAAGLSPALSVLPRETLSDAYCVLEKSVCRK